MKQPAILILTSKTGGGHISLAEALRDLLSPACNVHILDPQPRFFHWHYRLVSRYALWLWAAEFQVCNSPWRAQLAHALFTPLVASRLASVLQRWRPALIITTYPFLTYEVQRVLKRSGMPIPLVMLFADPNGVHASWLTERQAVVMAPTRETYAQALGVGFRSSSLHLVGWPVRAQFLQTDPAQHADLLIRSGLEPGRFTVFLQGGGEGAAQFAALIEQLLMLTPQLQIMLATGTNQSLLNRFQHTPRLYALPFTSTIAPFMQAADVIMGKAGPNMLFESVALGKPFIATAYIPGQEQANLEFIRRHKLGWIALDGQQQLHLLSKLMTNPAEMQAVRESVACYRRWNLAANEGIVPLIRDLLLPCK